MLIYNKDDIEFVTVFPRLLGHPVDSHNRDWFKFLTTIILLLIKYIK